VERKDEAQFWEDALLRVLPFAMGCHGWKYGGELINNVDQRVSLAARIADRALDKRLDRFGEKLYCCSFCGKNKDEVLQLVAGQDDAMICNECIAVAQEIVSATGGSKKPL
jgi:hypothetical protein